LIGYEVEGVGYKDGRQLNSELEKVKGKGSEFKAKRVD